MARLSSSKVLYRVVVAVFLELAAVVGLTELPVIGGRTAERVATMFVVTEIAALRLDLVEGSCNVASRSSGKVDSALRKQYSSLHSLPELLRYSSWFLGTL
jgi:hypothetical protein